MKENKSTIIGFVLMTLVFVGYMIYANFQAEKQQEQQAAAQIEQLAEQASKALDTPAEEQKVDSASGATKSKKEANTSNLYTESSAVSLAASNMYPKSQRSVPSLKVTILSLESK